LKIKVICNIENVRVFPFSKTILIQYKFYHAGTDAIITGLFSLKQSSVFYLCIVSKGNL